MQGEIVTTFPEPTDSLDPDLWSVYGDWLSDQGDETGGERARCIGRGLRKNPGGLYLVYHEKEGPWTSYTCRQEEDDPEMASLDSDAYSWSELPGRGYGLLRAISPLTRPKVLSGRLQPLVPLFWDKLAEIGGFIPPLFSCIPSNTPKSSQDRKSS